MARKKAGRFKTVNEELPRLIDDALSSVVRWQWWEGRPTPEQMIGEPLSHPPAKPLEGEPHRQIGHRTGFDADGRLRVVQGVVLGKSQGSEIWHYTSDRVRIIDCTRDDPPRVRQMHTVKPSLDRPESCLLENDAAEVRRKYVYENERIARVEIVDAADKPIVQRVPEPATVEPFTASEAGAMEKSLRAWLVAAVQKAVKRARIRQPVYCLVLAYDNENPYPLPPVIALGLERERAKWIKEQGGEARDLLWNPAEFKNYQTDALDLDDDQLSHDCERMSRTWGMDNEPARKFLNQVAADLAKASWPAEFKRTEDFVVFATDFECAQGEDNMKESVPPALLNDLKRRGVI